MGKAFSEKIEEALKQLDEVIQLYGQQCQNHARLQIEIEDMENTKAFLIEDCKKVSPQ
jgi:hypothetical protein